MSTQSTIGAQPRFSSATVHEAAGRIGALPAQLRPAYAGAALDGPAFPVICPVGDNLWLHRAIYAADPGDVLIVLTTGTVDYRYWGEILSEAALARGLGGLVIDGGVRDTGVLNRVGFPVFAATTCIRGTIKNPAFGGGFVEEVIVGDVPIRRGDLIIGDGDGVVAIPAKQVAQVLTASQARDQKEAAIIENIRNGASTIALFSLPTE